MAASAESLLSEIQSANYEDASIPKGWIPEVRAHSIVSAAEYPRASVRSVEISEFVKVYGIPARLLTPKSRSGYSYLVYDLADGYRMLVYIPSLSASRFAAAQLFRLDGQAEGPLLK